MWKWGFSGCLGLEYDVIGGQVGMRFQTGGECGQGWNQVVYGVHSCSQRERAAGVSIVKSTAYITLELVNKVHRLAVGMGSYGVSEFGT